jgi:hypothetical protein
VGNAYVLSLMEYIKEFKAVQSLLCLADFMVFNLRIKLCDLFGCHDSAGVNTVATYSYIILRSKTQIRTSYHSHKQKSNTIQLSGIVVTF